MNAAQSVIQKFGGQSALAALIGKGQTTVNYWAKTGIIPAKWRPILLNKAKENGIDLMPAEFDLDVQVIEENNVITIQKATHWGELMLGDIPIPCYVLENGERIFSLKGVVVALTGTEGGQLAEYIKVKSIRQYLPEELIPEENGSIPALLNFDTGGSAFAKNAIGVPVERFIDICIAYSTALQETNSNEAVIKLTDRQKEIAIRANAFLRATAKTGIVALVDEATGYQYDRPIDALQFKLNLFLGEEMRKWEKTYPDQLWVEFGRLTNWKGSLHSRPKYWGKLINELVYSYLDKDVYNWLKTNAPKPIHGMNYHQWLNAQYGLKKLMEHLWQLIGMASACSSMEELRRKMAEKYGRVPVQMTMYFPIEEKLLQQSKKG
jgi:hypothetical protein